MTPLRKGLSDRQRFFASLLFFAVTVVVIVLSASGRPAAPLVVTPGQSLPVDPTVRANLQNAAALALPSDQQGVLDEIQTLLDACPDYGQERRSQMQQHIDWLRDPAAIPADILLAMGAEPIGGLLRGMATYTAVQWRLLNQPAESCLLPVGRLVNTLLAANGEPTESAFTTP